MQFTDQIQDFNSSERNNILFSKPMSFDDWYSVVDPDIDKIDAWEYYEDYRHRNAQARLRNIDIRVTFSSNHKNPIPDRILNTEPTGKVTEELLNSYIVEDNAWYAKELSYIKRVFAMKAFAEYLETVMPAIILAGITFWRFFSPREAYDPETSYCYKMYSVHYAGKRAVDPKPDQEVEIQYAKPKLINPTIPKRSKQILKALNGNSSFLENEKKTVDVGRIYRMSEGPEPEDDFVPEDIPF